jgi:hypothetical protein
VDVGGKCRPKFRHLAGGLFGTLTVSLIFAAAALAVVPKVPVPKVEVPDVEVPDLELPAQPSVPLPSVELPSPQAAPPTTPSTLAGSGGVPVPSQSDHGGSAGSRVGRAVALTPGASSEWGGSISGGSGTTAGSRERRRAMQRQRRARERVFRRKIRRLAPCFYALSGFESRVLSLRAGLRGSRPQSRGYVARRLDVSRRRVHRTERRGLRKLQRTNSSDRCAFASGQRHHGLAVAVRMLVGAPVADDALVVAASEESLGGDRGEVAGTQASSDPDAAGIAVSLTGSGEGEYGSGGVAIWGLLAAAALLLTTAILAAQRRRQPPAAAAGAPMMAAQARADEESIADGAIPPPPWAQRPKRPGSPDDGRPRGVRSIRSRHRRRER